MSFRATKSNIYKVRIYYSIVSFTPTSTRQLTSSPAHITSTNNSITGTTKPPHKTRALNPLTRISTIFFVFIVNFVCAWATCTVLVLNSLCEQLFFCRVVLCLFFAAFQSSAHWLLPPTRVQRRLPSIFILFLAPSSQSRKRNIHTRRLVEQN